MEPTMMPTLLARVRREVAPGATFPGTADAASGLGAGRLNVTIRATGLPG